MHNWIVKAWATEQPGIRNMARALPGQFSKQKDGIKFWKKNKAAYLAALAEASQTQQAAQPDFRKLASLTIPGGVTKIGEYAFAGPTTDSLQLFFSSGASRESFFTTKGCGLKELVIPDSVTEMGESVFEESVIERVVLPKNLKEISPKMFYNAKNLKSITLPAGLTKIGENAFTGSGLQSIVIPDSVTVIDRDAFLDCADLREVTLSRGLQELPFGSFASCSQLKRLTIPANMKKISIGAFERCSALEEITFEGDVVLESNEKISGVFAFFACDNIPAGGSAPEPLPEGRKPPSPEGAGAIRNNAVPIKPPFGGPPSLQPPRFRA
jgi:hypothetical protein